MTDEIKEKAEIISEVVEDAIVTAAETPTEVDAQIAVAKAEAAADRVVEAAQILEMAANIEIANITQDAAQEIAQHENKIENVEYDLKWQQEQIQELRQQMTQVLQGLAELKPSTPQPLTENLDMPQTVTVETNPSENAADPQQVENPIQEIIEQIQPQKAQRKIRAI